MRDCIIEGYCRGVEASRITVADALTRAGIPAGQPDNERVEQLIAERDRCRRALDEAEKAVRAAEKRAVECKQQVADVVDEANEAKLEYQRILAEVVQKLVYAEARSDRQRNQLEEIQSRRGESLHVLRRELAEARGACKRLREERDAASEARERAENRVHWDHTYLGMMNVALGLDKEANCTLESVQQLRRDHALALEEIDVLRSRLEERVDHGAVAEVRRLRALLATPGPEYLVQDLRIHQWNDGDVSLELGRYIGDVDPEDAVGLGAALVRAGLHAQARAIGVPPDDVVVPMVEKL